MITKSAITRNPLIRLAVGHLPRHLKRLTFLASLTAIAKNSNKPEKALIHKLNEVLDLSDHGDGALKFPIHVSRLIWANQEVFQADIQTLTECRGTEDEAAKSAQKIASATPDWLRYGAVEEVAKDIMALFKSDSCIFPSARA